ETFLLAPLLPDYRPFSREFGYLFNSYYNAVGERLPRPQRGLLTRPTVDEVYQYRRYVDGRVVDLLEHASPDQFRQLAATLVLGLNHEQQHQELILTDLKHLLAYNPLGPVYRERDDPDATANFPLRWVSHPAGLCWIGHEGDSFAFDNET